MARVWYFVCDNFCLCVCIFVLFGISDASNKLNDLCYYSSDSTHHRMEHSIHIELLKENEFHNHQKRSAPSTTPLPLNIVSNKSWTLQKDPLPKRSDAGLLKQYHNLGINGTGQRQNVTLVTDPPDLLHIIPSVEPPLKTLTDEPSPENNAGDLPWKLTPEEVGVGDEIDKKDLEKNNITDVKTDTHIFYNSTTYNNPETGKLFWIDMKERSDVKVNELLSSSHRRAATVKLSFDFPFYGRYIQNVTVATGGFLYTGNYVHSWLAATQYIAPLMANFDTGLSNESFVKYIDNGTAFTVEWEKVALQDKPTNDFTFQVTLHKNGDIVFVYKTVPLLIKNIDEQHHPVKVGLSDAYILDRTVFFVRRKTIYEYHRVSFNKEEIRNWTVIYLRALPTCLDRLNCSSCLANDLNLNCTWCPSLKQCSTGQDRNRQFWIDKNCDTRNVTSELMCSTEYEVDTHLNDTLNYDVEGASKQIDEDYIGSLPRQSQLGASGYVAIIFLIAMISGFGVWTAYAYKNPHTTSGQMLIRYRPSQWRWRRGEARYTAATIHM